MRNLLNFSRVASRASASALALCVLFLTAQASLAQTARTKLDVTHYRIEAELQPEQRFLRATGDVQFTPATATRSVTFELNGSLKVEGIERNGRRLADFVQDAVGVSELGPSVRVDLGEVVPAGQPVTLRFRWSGALISPEGGPLATKRLAHVGPEVSYLMYAARWFPFNDYAADRATADITVSVPAGYEVAGSSDAPATRETRAGQNRFRFVHTRPALVGNIAAARYQTRTVRVGAYEIQFFTLPGGEARVESYGELIGRALKFYTEQYGAPATGTRLVVAQIDDESLDAYAAPGMQFLAPKFYAANRPISSDERVTRELAYQWWGQTVGLKSFDDVWLSQGLAEWSAFRFREATLTEGALETAQRDLLERRLLFDSTSSIARAPSQLDDQSAAYQAIMFDKGAMVFRTLRETLGADTFNRLLRTFYERNRNASVSVGDFERLASEIAGRPMRYFFARYVEGTGAPEFTTDYQIIRTRAGKFRARGTVKQNLENLRLPIELLVRAEGDNKSEIVQIEDKSEDFDIETNGKPLSVVIDPNYRILRTSDELRISVAARRGVELYREGQYADAQRQLEEALKLNRSSSWIYYHLGLLYLEQQNYQLALDNFQAALDGDVTPSWIEAWARIKRGNAYDAQGDRNRAVNEYNKAVQTGITYDNAPQAARAFLATPYDPRATVQAQR
jgi:aminopeptidase N